MAVIDSAIRLWRAGNYSGSGNWLEEKGSGDDWVPDGPAFTAQSGSDLAYFLFDGVNDHMEIPDGNALEIRTNDWTVVYAIQTPANVAADGFPFLNTKGAFGTQDGWEVRDTGTGNLFVAVGDGVTNFSDQDGPLSNTTDHEVALRLDRTAQELEAFIDGTGSGSPTDVSTMDADIVGTNPRINDTGAVFAPGRVYGIAIFDSALSDADIATAGDELTTLIPTAPTQTVPVHYVGRV